MAAVEICLLNGEQGVYFLFYAFFFEACHYTLLYFRS